MSLQLTKEATLFHQRILKASGFDLVLDGIWGKHTDDADKEFQSQSYLLRGIGAFDLRSESIILTLVLNAQEKCRLFLKQSLIAGYDVRVISGTRSYEEQNFLYAQGRSKSGNKVTNAKGGQSLHNFGIAWDIAIFKNGKYIIEEDDYVNLHHIIDIPTVDWGGNWNSIHDIPHYQLHTLSTSISNTRYNFEKGLKYF